MFGWFPNLLQAVQRDASQADAYALLVQWGAVLGASLAAAAWDLRVRRIPNALTVPLFFTGLVWCVWTAGLAGLGSSLMGCIVAGLPFVILYAYAGGGAGDAKLMGAVGAWLGVTQAVAALLAVVLVGAALGLAQAACRGRLRDVSRRMGFVWRTWMAHFSIGKLPPRLEEPASTRSALQMPYGVSIFCGLFVAAMGALLWQA